MKRNSKYYELKTRRNNLLIEMTSFCDQCLRNGYQYLPDQKDLDEIDRLDSELLTFDNYL